MYARQVGEQVVLVMDEEQAEELFVYAWERFTFIDTSSLLFEIYEALGPVMEG